jgi:hypothetical protein
MILSFSNCSSHQPLLSGPAYLAGLRVSALAIAPMPHTAGEMITSGSSI